MAHFAKSHAIKTSLVVEKVFFVSQSGPGKPGYEEIMPSINAPHWVSWCALRLLPPEALCDFETEVDRLFDSYKKGAKTWAEYSDDKKALLLKYLTVPLKPVFKK